MTLLPLPLTSPDTTGWTVLRDPNPAATWQPAMVANTDYVLLPAIGQTGPRTAQIIIQGGRNKVGLGLWTTRADADGGPNIMLDGGSNPGYLFLEGCLMDASGGKESDGIRSRLSQIRPDSGSGLTDLYMLRCREAGMRGQTNNGVSTCNGAVLAGDGTITVASGTQFSPPCTVKIDSELIQVSSRAGAVLTVTRGVLGTVAAGHASGATVTQTDDNGQTTSGTHADCIQLAGGLGTVTLDTCTLESGYSNLQLQQEQSETGAYGGFASPFIIRVGSTATVTTSAAHGLNVGDYIQVGNGVQAGGQDCSPTGWNGTYRVDSTPTSTTLTYDLGGRTPAAIVNGGAATWKRSLVSYVDGDVRLRNTNLKCGVNQQQWFGGQPGETLNALRIGGRPDYKGYEDQTNVIAAWQGACQLTGVYLELYNSGAGGVLNPGSAANVWPTAQGVLNAGVWTWPSWAQVTGQITVGHPPNGDFCPSWLPGLNYPGHRRRGRRT